MSPILAAILLQVSANPSDIATTVPAAVKEPSKSCREMYASSSHLGAVKICKTRAEWVRWQRCHSATRYCAPTKRAAFASDRVVCRSIKRTGSRIEVERVCAKERDWYLAEQEAQATIRDRQNRSMLSSEGGGDISSPRGPGPQ